MKNIVFAAAHAEIVPDFMVFDKKALPQEGAYTLVDMFGVLQSL